MLTRDRLVELHRDLRDSKVLSVYLDADQHDPANRGAWRVAFDEGVARVRQSLGEDDDSAGFEAAVGQVRAELDEVEAFLPGRGWVAFATPERLLYSESLPVPMPDQVIWEDGIRAAPYVRGLKQERSVVVALLDSRRARIFEYRDGTLTEQKDLRADTFLGDLTDINTAKRATRRSGVRGKTGTDAAQTFLDVGTTRMVQEVADEVAARAGDEGYVVLGGTGEMIAAVAKALPDRYQDRMLRRPPLHVEMKSSEVERAVEAGASELTQRRQAALVSTLLEEAGANGRACLGREETSKALEERRVGTLLLSRSLIRRDPDFADACTREALEQNAEIEEVSGDAAGRLDEEGGGVGARLRFRLG